MKQKIKYFILITLLMLSILPALLIKEKTKASYLNLVILDNGSFDDLPDEDTLNNWNINKYIFASYQYNGKTQYLLNYYGNEYNILFTTEKFIDASTIEWEEENPIYSNDLKTLLQDLEQTIKTLNPNANNTLKFYIQYDYIDYIGYWQTNYNYPLLIDNTYESFYTSYVYNYGTINTIYQQYNFYQMIKTQLTTENVMDIQQYQEETNERINKLLEQVNADWRQQMQEYGQQQFNAGRIYEQEHPSDTTQYTLSSMFNAISMYPIAFFTEGLNVQLFGINIGELILGIFMIALLIIIIRMIITIIKGGK